MANRRMFAKVITNSGKFLKMPPTSRLLYYDFGMNADDDGYVEWFTVVRMTGSTEQDMRVLQANGFIKVFDDNVLIILDWNENNQIRADRYLPSKYKGIYDGLPLVAEMSTIGLPLVDQGKVSEGKVSEGKNTPLDKPKVTKKTPTYGTSPEDIAKVIHAMTVVDPKNKLYYGNTSQRTACDFLVKEYGLEAVLGLIEGIPKARVSVPYFPSITTPCELRDKWVKVFEAVHRMNKSKKPDVEML